MSLISTLFIVLLVLSALISLLIGAYVYRERRKTIGAQWLVLIFVSQTVWSLAYTLQLTRSQVSWWLTLERFVVTGATFVIAGWFLFVLTYTGYDQRLSSPQLAGLLVPFLGGLLTAWTNQYHRLFWQFSPRPEVLVGPGGRYIKFAPGSVYSAWVVYLFVIVIATLLMLGAKYVRSRSLHRGQVGLLFIAILLPLIGNILFSTFNATTLAVDVTPVLFTATSILVVAALTRYRMLDSVPISQHALLEQLTEGVIVTDEQAEVLHCNQAAIEMFGDELVGETITDHLPVDGEMTGLQSVAETGLSTVVDGHQRHLDVTRTPYTDPRGEQRGAIIVFQDVTERIERARELTRQNERLDQFASVVSHDLRSPLDVASGRLRLAREECENPHLDAVEQAHNRMQTLIEDALMLAREGATVTEMDRVDLKELITSCWHYVEAPAATIHTETDAVIKADRDRLQRLVRNLLENAVNHGGESVTITVGAFADGFYVEDDGPGLADENLDNVFEPGYSTSENGTGYGLSIVSEIVEAHGWTIEAMTVPSGGARFEISGVEFADE